MMGHGSSFAQLSLFQQPGEDCTAGGERRKRKALRSGLYETDQAWKKNL